MLFGHFMAIYTVKNTSPNVLQKIMYFLLSNLQRVTLSYFKSAMLHFIVKIYDLLTC